ncbi:MULTISPECIES: HD domain-containing protein [Thermomonosporaceae]|uniref:HD domain-containing protein n=1 Tax=Thermomonosporaceae TaxID=2012 RepID=UPI00255A9DD3|nr:MULTISPECIES: HD domain-containing protein [Thermomonosporaceae]MDL4770901.1 HD domain-containing protein [Actinomadura xylanilytica]
MADHFAEFGIPDTDAARQADALVFEIESPTLANHSVRTYLFGRAVGEGLGLRPGTDYDDELLYLACILHDVGLTGRGDREQRFEVDGADAAGEFLTELGLPADRVRTVWEAIALHTSNGIASRMRPEIALTHAGAGADVTGLGARHLPEGFAERVHAAFPRLGCGELLTEAIVDQAVRNPAKAPLFTFPSGLLGQAHPGTPVPEWRRVIAAAWPGVA